MVSLGEFPPRQDSKASCKARTSSFPKAVCSDKRVVAFSELEGHCIYKGQPNHKFGEICS